MADTRGHKIGDAASEHAQRLIAAAEAVTKALGGSRPELLLEEGFA